jgi:hypothetical protein
METRQRPSIGINKGHDGAFAGAVYQLAKTVRIASDGGHRNRGAAIVEPIRVSLPGLTDKMHPEMPFLHVAKGNYQSWLMEYMSS